MALFDANRNRNYKPYISTEPVYRGITYPDNVHHPFVGYSETQNSSYVTTTEQVVEFRRFGAIADDHKHSPTRKTVYKDHGVADKSPLSPWSSSSPKKTDDFSPKFHNQFVYSQSKGSPRNDKSPPSREYHYYTTQDHNAKYNNLSSDHDYDEDEDDHEISYNEKHKGSLGYVPPLGMNSLRPIKTRTDTEFQRENTRSSPVSVVIKTPNFNASPKKEYGYQDIIDSAEARRRYSRASPRAAEEKYMGTIDSREAARKYNGVFMSNW